MKKLISNNIELQINEEMGAISSLKIGKRECCVSNIPLFIARLRDKKGECAYIDAAMAKNVSIANSDISFGGFNDPFSKLNITVSVCENEGIEWGLKVESVPCEYAVEWVEIPKICMPRLIDNDENGGRILFPYDEGLIISDETKFVRYEPEFPSSGAYLMFPNKVCSQFFAYLFDDIGLYIGAHDTKRGLKCIDFYPSENGIAMQIRLFSGADYGKDFKTDFPIVWKTCDGNWMAAADIYRNWFENNLPKGVLPIKENAYLPKWYEDSPLVVTYPVRGIHDMDKMEPNELFPYVNALPILNKIKKAINSPIMALLMHWEGTAPWAPPYVWPPFGGVEKFNEFKDALHKNGDLLGVYCSGFGYTSRSTIIEDYNCEEKIKNEDVLRGVCHSPSNKPELGITCCPYQRYGYDICPASSRGREILFEAYTPLFKSGVDYAQILDQNHGGGQYLCYAQEHDHPPMPGDWMTEAMQELLCKWNTLAPNMLFGCESAASEPFIGNLLMSDNRFELNYAFGVPVPVYAYIYHEYVRNFMGNQVGCPFDTKINTLSYRLAYSFSIGDIMTLTLSPNGSLMTHWGTRDFESCPNMDNTLALIRNLMDFYKTDGKKYLYNGRMKATDGFKCESIEIPMTNNRGNAILPRLLSSSWEAENGRTAYIVVNPEAKPVSFKIRDKEYTAKPLNATLTVI
ncbi:MAG: hypothetical protein IJ039_03900 [Clostridia bacterium]|nr:hypothetical protein [Clostridia bacterium]